VGFHLSYHRAHKEHRDFSLSFLRGLGTLLQQENKARIARGQSPILALIALSTYLGGLGIIGYEIYYLASAVSLLQKTGVSLLDTPNLASFLTEYLVVFFELTPLGLAMMLGSLIGMRDVWRALLFPD